MKTGKRSHWAFNLLSNVKKRPKFWRSLLDKESSSLELQNYALYVLIYLKRITRNTNTEKRTENCKRRHFAQFFPKILCSALDADDAWPKQPKLSPSPHRNPHGPGMVWQLLASAMPQNSKSSLIKENKNELWGAVWLIHDQSLF